MSKVLQQWQLATWQVFNHAKHAGSRSVQIPDISSDLHRNRNRSSQMQLSWGEVNDGNGQDQEPAFIAKMPNHNSTKCWTGTNFLPCIDREIFMKYKRLIWGPKHIKGWFKEVPTGSANAKRSALGLIEFTYIAKISVILRQWCMLGWFCSVSEQSWKWSWSITLFSRSGSRNAIANVIIFFGDWDFFSKSFTTTILLNLESMKWYFLPRLS